MNRDGSARSAALRRLQQMYPEDFRRLLTEETVARRPVAAPIVETAGSSTVHPKLLPVYPDAGKALGGLGRTKVYELITSGELRTVKIGRRRFVPASAIDEYVSRLVSQQEEVDQ